jgi:hypothetical protein
MRLFRARSAMLSYAEPAFGYRRFNRNDTSVLYILQTAPERPRDVVRHTDEIDFVIRCHCSALRPLVANHQLKREMAARRPPFQPFIPLAVQPPADQPG